MGGDADGSILRAEVRRILGEQTPEEQLRRVVWRGKGTNKVFHIGLDVN